MAKWGEGDPRWIVEERADATNVNNWHWTERDATNWSSEKLKELLVGLKVENDEGMCEITEVSKMEGEASINNRKGKLIFFYEWNLQAKWLATSISGIKYKGDLDVPNLSDENDKEDLDISMSLCKDEPDTPLFTLMKKALTEEVRKALDNYVELLKTEFTQGMILPTANGVTKQTHSLTKVEMDKTQIGSGSTAPTPSTGVKIPTCKFSLKDTFLTSPEELYRAFLNKEMVQAFTRTAAVVEAEKGGKFRLLGGNVFGEFQELIPEEKIVMKWRYNTWPSEHYATVMLNFIDKGNETELNIECRAVPQSEEDHTREGWQRYYCQAIKQTFGFGARLC